MNISIQAFQESGLILESVDSMVSIRDSFAALPLIFFRGISEFCKKLVMSMKSGSSAVYEFLQPP